MNCEPPMPMKKYRPSLGDRLGAMTIKRVGCWGWKGFKDGAGYGRIGLVTEKGKRAVQAQRVAWMVYRGPIPKGAHVLHKCDNPECTNPEHLFTGTNLDNIKDRMAKGRSRSGDMRGEKNPRAKLTAVQVEAIRADIRPSRRVAAEYCVSKSMINHIRAGDFWKAAAAP